MSIFLVFWAHNLKLIYSLFSLTPNIVRPLYTARIREFWFIDNTVKAYSPQATCAINN